MILSLDTTISEFNDALAEFIRFQRLTIAQGLRYQGRLLGEQLIKFTPPKTRAQGRAAVKRDIERAVKPLKPSDFKSAEIRKLIRKRDYHALEIVFSRFDSGELKNVRVLPFSPDLHQKQRDRRGRITKFKRIATPDADQVRDYIAKVQGHVGRAKGGWSASVIALGGQTSDWIAAHTNAGEIEDRAHLRVDAYIRMVNKSEWASGDDDERVVISAIRSRTPKIHQSIAKAQAEAKQQAKLK